MTYLSAEFHPNGKLLLGTSNGKLVIYDLILAKAEGEPIRIGGMEQGVTKIQAFINNEENPIFLVIIDQKELYLFNEKGRICRQIDYGDAGKEYALWRICNI